MIVKTKPVAADYAGTGFLCLWERHAESHSFQKQESLHVKLELCAENRICARKI